MSKFQYVVYVSLSYAFLVGFKVNPIDATHWVAILIAYECNFRMSKIPNDGYLRRWLSWALRSDDKDRLLCIFYGRVESFGAQYQSLVLLFVLR